MSQTDLIKKLSTNLTVVKVKKYGFKQYFYALGAGLFSILVTLLFSGLRGDLKIMINSPLYISELFLLITLAVSSVAAAFALSIPSLSKSTATKVATASLLSWLAILTILLVNEQNQNIGWSFGCAQEILIASLTPAIILFLLFKNINLIKPTEVSWFMLLSSAAFGAISTHLSCPASYPGHVLIWHAFPVLLIAIIGKLTSNFYLKKL